MSEHEREQLLTALQKKLADLAGGTPGKDSLAQERSCDPLDEAQAELTLALAVGRMSLDWETKKAVETALDKIRSGDYGICENCGASIHPKRLEAVPWATHCVSCQSMRESDNDRDDSSPEPETIQ
jgi:DnaK suppressor protein